MSQEPVIIPDKIYFKIGEVCELLGVQAHVLRYWETEFPMLSPQKNNSGQRSYRRRDVEIALRIKQLLYNEMFTIAGARKKLQTEQREGKARSEAAKQTPASEKAIVEPLIAEPVPEKPAEQVSEASRSKRSVAVPFTPIDREDRGPALFDGLYDDDVGRASHTAGNASQRFDASPGNREALAVLANHLLELREMLKNQPV